MKWIAAKGGSYQLDEILKDAIKYEIGIKMREMVTADVKQEIRRYVNDELATEIKTEMKIKQRDFMTKHILPGPYGNEITADKYLEDKFMDFLQDKNSILITEVRKIAERWGEALKQQYDIAYASKLVQTLNDQGLLLPNVAQLLLAPKG